MLLKSHFNRDKKRTENVKSVNLETRLKPLVAKIPADWATLVFTGKSSMVTKLRDVRLIGPEKRNQEMRAFFVC